MGADILNYISSPTLQKIDRPSKKRAPTAKLPFTYEDLKKAIPPHCFKRSLLHSLSYVVYDLTAIFTLYYLASNYIPLLPPMLQYLAWPTYWFVQSCVMVGIWIVAHECGHHAFSDYEWLDDTIGFIIHSCLFIPYFAWKFSHARHHANTGSIEKDETYVPKTKPSQHKKYFNNPLGRILFLALILFFGQYLYLVFNLSGKRYDRSASHFNPYSPIYSESQRLFIIISDIGLFTVVYGLYNYVLAEGLLWVIAIYGVPLCLTNAWMVTVTYLHHTHPSLPHYDSSEWDWLRGALSTVDRDYGILNHVFHHVTDCHVVHHLFKTLPHYHLQEATKAIKPVLGEYYQFDSTSIPKALYQSAKECVFVAPDDHSRGVYWYRELFE